MVVHLDLIEDRPHIGAAEGDRAIGYVRAHQISEGDYFLFAQTRSKLRFGNSSLERGPGKIMLGFDRLDAGFERRVAHISKAVFNCGVQAIEPYLGILCLRAKRRQTRGAVVLPRGLTLHQAREQVLDPVRLKEALDETVRDDAVELVHRDRTTSTGFGALLRGSGACVVAVASGFAGAQGHAAAASRAGGKPGQKDGTADHARRRGFRIPRPKRCLHRIECLGVDDRIDGDRDLILVRLCLPRLPDKAVEAVLSFVGLAGENVVERSYAPARADPRAIAPRVEPRRDRLDAHRAASSVALAEELEHEAHDLGLDRIDHEPFFDLCPALLCRDDGISVRRLRAVPEALPRIFLHGPEGVLRILLGLVLVEQGEHLPHHDAHRIVAEVLRDADKTDACLAQAADVIFESEMVTGEATERVHDDDIGGRAAGRRHIEKPLQFRATIIHAAGAGLDELDRNLPTARRTVGESLTALVGDREVGFRLAAGRYAEVEGRAQRLVGPRNHFDFRHLHGRSFSGF